MLPLSSALLLAAAAVVARSSPFLEHRQEIANGTTSDLASNIKATASATTAAAPATASSLQIISPTSLPDSPPNTAYVNSSMPVPTSAIANGTIGLPSSATTPSQLPNTAYTSSMTNVTAAPAGVSATASTATASAASAAETSPQAFSPPNYPTPEVRGEGAWAEAVRKAKETLSTEGWDLAAKVRAWQPALRCPLILSLLTATYLIRSTSPPVWDGLMDPASATSLPSRPSRSRGSASRTRLLASDSLITFQSCKLALLTTHYVKNLNSTFVCDCSVLLELMLRKCISGFFPCPRATC